MWQQLLLPEVPLAQLAIRTVIAFIGLMVLLRLSGKRQVGQLGAIEFVIMLLISEVVQNAMIGGDNSLTAGLLSAAILIAMGALVSLLSFRSSTMSRLLEGGPTRLVHDGRVIRAHMNRERLSNTDLKILLRKNGVDDFRTIDEVILEADGSLSITRKGEEPFEFEDA